MSGIAGIIHFDGAPVEPALIEKMTAAMDYRGPDGINHWVRGAVALGQCTLRTTQESLEETQPLANEDETLVLVMDGWLSNWEELRAELLAKSVTLRTCADAELVLRAYEVWGKDCLAHIDGDFALVIWDQERREAFCARDHIGNKPFHYYWDGRRLIIASDLHAVLAVPSVPQEPNTGMIAEVLSREWLSRDETIWRGVMRLVAAHQMTATGDGSHIARYWSPPLDVNLAYTRDEEYIEHYRELFCDCVRRGSRSHRPAAYDVSGGHDSSAIFCVAEHLRKSGRLPAPAIKGYTTFFDVESDANEIEYARAVGQHLGLTIEEIAPFTPNSSWFEARAREYRDLPGSLSGATAVNIREAMASAGSRIALSGEGGDHWVGGSRLYYAEQIAAGEWAGLYESFRADVATVGVLQATRWLVRHGLAHLLPKAIKDLGRGLSELLSPNNNAFWLSPGMKARINDRRMKIDRRYTNVRNIARRAKFIVLNDAFFSHAMEKAHRLASRCGIEMRTPFYSRLFIEFAFATPERLRRRGSINKFIHLQACKDFLPPSLFQRTTKAELTSVLRPQLYCMKDDFTRKIPSELAEWVSPGGMAQLYQHYATSGSGSWELWGVYECASVFWAK